MACRFALYMCVCGDDADPLSEQRSSSVYVPRDEAFSEVKQVTFSINALKNVLHALVPQLEIAILEPNLGFPFFAAIDSLFHERITLPQPKSKPGNLQSMLPRLVKAISDSKDALLRFETPEMMDSMCLSLSTGCLFLSLASLAHLYLLNLSFCRRQIRLVQR